MVTSPAGARDKEGVGSASSWAPQNQLGLPGPLKNSSFPASPKRSLLPPRDLLSLAALKRKGGGGRQGGGISL